ncbi:hypothetical protein [Streptomyces sp. NPDC092295]|uniref:hypothetical protein n=1 Tax=Streptomyces sp. NPDC092295 TaxID=3366011 RepID=UPI0038076F03
MLTTTGFATRVLPCALDKEAGWPWWAWVSFAVTAAPLTYFVLTLRHLPDPLMHPSVPRDGTARRGVLLMFVFNTEVPSFTYLFLHPQCPRSGVRRYPSRWCRRRSPPRPWWAAAPHRQSPADWARRR